MTGLAASAPAMTLAGEFEHERLEVFHDRATGLTGAVAIHSTALGPAMGGLRIRRYHDLEAAAVDALRLARAMTLKNSTAGLSLGGGKAVLLDDDGWDDREARMLAFAGVLERLGGCYVTAEDVGTTPADMDLIGTRTRWVAGRSAETGGWGDPSPSTARTVFGAIEVAVRFQFNAPLYGARVGVLGAGKVGAALVALLVAAGACVTVADVDTARAQSCAAAGIDAVPVDGFIERELDVLAPCAMGELIREEDVAALRCQIVAGAANNPLVDRAAAIALQQAGILYVPDFVANCGGIVHVAAEYERLTPSQLEERLGACVARAGQVLADARTSGSMPLDVAVEYALHRVAAAEGTASRDSRHAAPDRPSPHRSGARRFPIK